jgi:hypothetical protein
MAFTRPHGAARPRDSEFANQDIFGVPTTSTFAEPRKPLSYGIDGLDQISSPIVAERWVLQWPTVALADAIMIEFARLIVTL